MNLQLKIISLWYTAYKYFWREQNCEFTQKKYRMIASDIRVSDMSYRPLVTAATTCQRSPSNMYVMYMYVAQTALYLVHTLTLFMFNPWSSAEPLQSLPAQLFFCHILNCKFYCYSLALCQMHFIICKSDCGKFALSLWKLLIVTFTVTL